MKKLKLNLENLKVNSFQTSTKIEKKGTVAGNELSLNICPETLGCPTEDCTIICSAECTARTCFCN